MKRQNGANGTAQGSTRPKLIRTRRKNRLVSNGHPDSRKRVERKTQTGGTSPRRSRGFRLPQAKGKVLERVEFITGHDYHSLSINFQDRTCINFAIDANFALEAVYSDWTTGNQRILLKWLPISNS